MTDIHRQNAAALFNVPEAEVDDLMRRTAKTLGMFSFYHEPPTDVAPRSIPSQINTKTKK